MMCWQGTLIFLCAGDKDLFDYASPLLDVMGKAKFFLGEVSPSKLDHLLPLLMKEVSLHRGPATGICGWLC